MVFGFQDRNLKTFRTWFSVSKTETWKLLGRDFQDVGSQFWDLDFTQGLHSGLRPRAPTSICEFQGCLLCTMEQSNPCPFCWVRCQVSPLGQASQCTEHNEQGQGHSMRFKVGGGRFDNLEKHSCLTDAHFSHYILQACMIITGRLCHITWSRKRHDPPA
jgi:hypothetical protein